MTKFLRTPGLAILAGASGLSRGFLAGLALLPVAVLATPLPVYVASKRIDTRRRAKETAVVGAGRRAFTLERVEAQRRVE